MEERADAAVTADGQQQHTNDEAPCQLADEGDPGDYGQHLGAHEVDDGGDRQQDEGADDR